MAITLVPAIWMCKAVSCNMCILIELLYKNFAMADKMMQIEAYCFISLQDIYVQLMPSATRWQISVIETAFVHKVSAV